nr:pentatricopeptide repeat-containing protein At5g50280, chloroplastic [Ipomoea batatas]
MEALGLGYGLPHLSLLRSYPRRQQQRSRLCSSASCVALLAPRFSPMSGASIAKFQQNIGIKMLELKQIEEIAAARKRGDALACVNGSSTSSIFLHFLLKEEEDDEDEDDEEEEEEEKEEEEEEEERLTSKINDPIMNFFKKRVENPDSVPDVDHHGKFSLSKNRKTSWHLSPSIGSTIENEEKGGGGGGGEDDDDDDDYEIEKLQTGLPITKVDGVVGEILEKARSLPENVTLGEVLREFEGRIGEKECVEVLGLLGEEGLLKGCLYFFEWMRLNEPSLLTPRACTVLFPILGRAGMGNELILLFRSLPDHKPFRNVHIYNAAISGLLSSRRYNDAWGVYEMMQTNNVQPDRVTCSILITVMRKMGSTAKEAWQIFEKMNKKGAMWSLEAVGALVKSFCDEGLKREALIIQSEMEKRGISSNAIVYNTIMDAYSKSNQIEEAEGLLAEMKMKGISPTSATYNILMDAYSRRMQPDVVEKLLEEMENTGLEPNVKSYTCLISAYGRQKKMGDRAADAFLRMKKVGIKPNSHSYAALIHAYSVSGWHEKAYIAFKNMLREGIKPSIQAYTALLDAFRCSGDTEALMEIWKMMIKDKIQGTRVTFNTLLDGFAKQGHYVEARDVICEFGKVGLQPTVMTYNMLMNAYARGGQESKLPQLLEEMAAHNLKPDSVTYATMIYAYIRVRDFKRAFYYHKKMVQSGEVPDAKLYQKLRAILEEKASFKNRKDRSALKGIIRSNMGVLKQKKRKKDEFWKYKKNRSRTDQTAQYQRKMF